MAPVLYTFRRCPYAIRARMALSYANIQTEEREVDLKHKPIELLQISPKATVPVLVLENGQIIDQSLDIMKWALNQSDPEQWLLSEFEKESEALIHTNDSQFKPILDQYKYSSRAEVPDPQMHRAQAEKYLEELNTRLKQHQFLLANHRSFADIAIFPFIRQFYRVDETWFLNSGYTCLIHWLNYFLNSELFRKVMAKRK